VNFCGRPISLIFRKGLVTQLVLNQMGDFEIQGKQECIISLIA